ncbi:helix-turn-helix transcriptional regulator [Ralstonia insidiosa]|jgi:AraC-like DNA-binding protein/quercetin dioxygenase-like cupin family protein|uniref:AraC family transcriptional regulator n=1 Tax=Ralstonia TaxID=48736 RepID=UPI000A7D5662|nr:helix-turn-helix transcriptional regulator [Ralstonia insidiosa]MBX3773614.1 helix-turn-helix transcriptional regulator [Ralstonia pickettii]MBX3812582.1 helix-turn-helix transcriptional regulator [Ralstonia pickettii]MBX3818434.1 helix-turn-helix transcriptional regulator [Ralstonia insidiosa]MBX3836735.1 helix-turn-helix transcriptional regulator [Ralstonia insidiosa]MBX3897141.1 helix-turn-helix transcriptional regulator [Ralstonia insidiosa]
MPPPPTPDDSAHRPRQRHGPAEHTKSLNPRDYQNTPGLAAVMPKRFPNGFVVAAHEHVRAQLIFATSGVVEVTANHALWRIPPQKALWIPQGMPHAMRACGDVEMRTAYVSPEAYGQSAPPVPRMVNVSPLLRELIVRVAALPIEHLPAGREALMTELMLAEIEWSPDQPLPLPSGSDRRLTRICDAILATPSDPRTLEDWAAEAGASSRTLSRLFVAQTGLSFVHWRQQARICAALPLLAAGVPVTAVSAELGYETVGAFSTLFRRFIGVPPSAYAMLSDSA